MIDKCRHCKEYGSPSPPSVPLKIKTLTYKVCSRQSNKAISSQYGDYFNGLVKIYIKHRTISVYFSFLLLPWTLLGKSCSWTLWTGKLILTANYHVKDTHDANVSRGSGVWVGVLWAELCVNTDLGEQGSVRAGPPIFPFTSVLKGEIISRLRTNGMYINHSSHKKIKVTYGHLGFVWDEWTQMYPAALLKFHGSCYCNPDVWNVCLVSEIKNWDNCELKSFLYVLSPTPHSNFQLSRLVRRAASKACFICYVRIIDWGFMRVRKRKFSGLELKLNLLSLANSPRGKLNSGKRLACWTAMRSIRC